MMASVAKMQLAFFALAVGQQQVVTSPYGFLVLPFSVQPTPSNSGISCLLHSGPHIRRDDYTYMPDIGGYKLHTRARPWVEARLICEEEGAHLAIINSVAESNALASFYQRSKPITGTDRPMYAAIGFHDLYREGEHVTIHGESLSKAGFDQWGGGQPDNIGQGEDCGSIDKHGKLNDINCVSPYGFICEVPLTSTRS